MYGLTAALYIQRSPVITHRNMFYKELAPEIKQLLQLKFYL